MHSTQLSSNICVYSDWIRTLIFVKLFCLQDCFLNSHSDLLFMFSVTGWRGVGAPYKAQHGQWIWRGVFVVLTRLFFIDAKMILHYRLLSSSTSSGLLKPIELLVVNSEWQCWVCDRLRHMETEAAVYCILKMDETPVIHQYMCLAIVSFWIIMGILVSWVSNLLGFMNYFVCVTIVNHQA